MSTTTTTTTAIAEQVYDGLEKAWNAADGAAFAAPFAADATFVDIRGSLHHGRDAIAGGHQGIFATIYADSVVRYTVEDSREVAPGCLLVHARGDLVAPRVFPEPVTARSTALLVDSPRGWEIATFHNTLVAS